MTKLRSYRGVRALVTGASSGIGRSLALRLARNGARVALVARRADELEQLAAEIRAAGGEAAALSCDVADAEQVAKTADRAREAWGGIDLLVNNAGYGHHRSFLEWSVEDIERMMRVNYLGSVYFTKALLPQMVEQRRGWVVFVASVAGKIASPEESAYVATKFAMVGLAASLSLEVEDAGVHVLTVCPGVIRTPFFDAEALSRMAPAAKKGMVEVEPLVDAILDALAKGKHEITFPRGIAPAYAIQAIAPEFMRRAVRRNTIDALAKARGR
ncbi:MAG: SDR family NAD(P)-dependent oxidoreductase [Deltaproteobacteria bacterium]|nr:MAG: SDR family NAD(P)-dependent oxidoreductase [Deltaproteobacteria bacterium]